MAVRNFWVEANIDDRETTMAGGPRGKSGGLSVKLYQRDKGGGKAVPVLKINCWEAEGRLYTSVRNKDGKEIALIETER